MNARWIDSKDRIADRNKRLQSIFETITKDFKFENFSKNISLSEGKIETSFVLFEIFNLAKLVCTLTLKENRSHVQINTTTRLCTPDFAPISLTHPNIIKLMMRYFIKLNGSFRFGYFAIDSTNGNTIKPVLMDTSL